MQTTYAITSNQLMQEENTLYDMAAERALLALLMKHPELIVEAERTVKPEWLYFDLNQYVFRIMLWIYKQASVHGWGLNFDPLYMLMCARQVGQQFEQQFLSRTDGMDHVRQIEVLKPAVNLEQFPAVVAKITDCSTRVDIYRAGRRMQESAMNFGQNPAAKDIAIAHEASLAEIAMRGMTVADGRITKMGDEGDEFVAKCNLNMLYSDLGLFNLNVPQFPFWMSLMNGGFRRKGLTIVAARPKVGKSTLLLSLAICMAVHQRYPVLYMDTEMSREEMYSRGLSHVSGVREFDLLSGRFFADAEMEPKVLQQLEAMRQAPLYYVNVAGMPAHMLPAVIRQFRNQYVGTRELQDPRTGRKFTFSNPGAVIYDWMKLPDPGGLKNAGEYQLLGFLASTLKDAGMKNDLPIIGGAQNNRSAIGVDEDKWEEMAESFVAGSDRLAQFCTSLLILRNVTAKEQDLILNKWGPRAGEKPETPNALHYNQVLHYVLQRGGPDWRKGIPLYIHRGTAKYSEVADDETRGFMFNVGKIDKQLTAKAELPPKSKPEGF